MLRKVEGGRIIPVVGMQYGSEGKGAVTTYLAPLIDIGVRVGASNAGHTIYFRGGKFIMRQVPAVWINPEVKLVIGRGAMISPDILLSEIDSISRHSEIKNRLFIDAYAHVINEQQIENESRTDLASRIGSTSATSREGIGMASADKVLRSDTCVLAKDFKLFQPYLADTVEILNRSLDNGRYVLLEGTQGFGLSLDHGNFPFVTSRDTSVSALIASTGLCGHNFETNVIGVARTYPIRVAGNSGPFGDDSEEVSWGVVTRAAGADTPIIEMTSVTGKVRRVATFSWKDFLRACDVNRPAEIALTFADYLDWGSHEKETLSTPVLDFIDRLEMMSGVHVTMVKTGPETMVDLENYRRSILRRIS